VKTEGRLEKVNLDEVLYIEGMRDYRRIHTLQKRIMTLQNFSEFERLIPASVICRVHKSYMVAISKIEEIERSRIKISNQLIPISDTYRDHFFSHIKS
jgi:DNA-binding LytR/AlgR family response regulator